MGYWRQNEQGASLQCEGNMIWGDRPADIMDKALKGIMAAFLRDRDRLPTEEEIKAGLLFSLRGALKRAESDAKAPVCVNCNEAGEPDEPLSAPLREELAR